MTKNKEGVRRINIKISCILLTYNSDIEKGSSVFHSIVSIFQQTYNNIELIIIENGTSKNVNTAKLKTHCDKLNEFRKIKITVKYLKPKKSLSWGSARNAGTKLATGEVLLFIDDDTIILSLNAFEQVAKLSKKYGCGYGAERLWTKDDWFQRSSDKILNDLLVKDYSWLELNSGEPPVNVRGEQNAALQTKTLIANFGFCRRSYFNKVGGFPDYKGYGYEDDYLMFQLFINNYKNVILNNISVVHINHPIITTTHRSLIPYFKSLNNSGYFWFHVSKILLEKSPKRKDVLEKLRPVHYAQEIEDAYAYYVKLRPLDIKPNNDTQYATWIRNNRFSKLEFTQKIYNLLSSTTIDSYIAKSNADFDNLSLIIQVAIKKSMVEIIENKIVTHYRFHYTRPNILKRSIKRKHLPDAEWNQFPCDEDSVKRRYEFILQRYPFTEYLRLGIIGDDDLLSLKFINDKWINLYVCEIDERLTKKIEKYCDNATVFKEDIRNTAAMNSNELASFITDPPYTFDGALNFIVKGLTMLSREKFEKEFYVILNEAMMGQKLNLLLKHLQNADVFIVDIKKNFCQYELPKNYKEFDRASKFMKHNSLYKTNIKLSSSSSLFIFRTTTPKINVLKSLVNTNKIYEHY